MINIDQINELKEMDDDGSMSKLKEIIKLYCDSTPKKIQRIKEAFTKSDFDFIKKEAHSLRSSSLNLGAEKLAKIASEIEYSPTPGSDLAEKLQHEFLIVEKELKAIIA